MKINIVGGGPAGLYFAILMKLRDGGHEITVFERNKADDTFGFGVVFSDETLGNFREADAVSYQEIINNFAYWDEIETHFKGTVVRSTGHGFCGMSRMKLLQVLQGRAQGLGVEIHFESDITDLADLPAADLVFAVDGVNSFVRAAHAAAFQPTVDYRPNRFVWLGTEKPLEAFTFCFVEHHTGIWNAHAYQYEPGLTTFIVETTDAAWRASGLAAEDEEATRAYCEEVFAEFLDGVPLLINRSHWRNFPNIKCVSWVHGNVVLAGDAAHTAHYSIGSGTKLAMEDAIALRHSLDLHHNQVAPALRHYDQNRHDEVERTQHAANVSLTWFEHVDRFWSMDPAQFNFSLLSRSKQITYDNLALRDPDLVERVRQWFIEDTQAKGENIPDKSVPPMFTGFKLRDMRLQNRVVVSPMCQYSADEGLVGDWHLVHLGSRAVGGAGLVFCEMTAVSKAARISPGCAGIYTEAHTAAWARIVDFVHGNSAAKIAMQLGHAGRKGSTQLAWHEADHPLADGNWPILSASPLSYFPDSQVPKEMTVEDMARTIADFVRAAQSSEAAGFDMLEIHMAHGYLLASFISPLTNRRQDAFGGGIEARMKFPAQVFAAVRAVWPAHKPISVRLSASDWMDDGLSEADLLAVGNILKQLGVDLIDVSAGQTVPEQEPIYGRMFQTPFSDLLRNEVGIATLAVGNITSADQVNTIIASGRADLVALARPHLSDPYFTQKAAAAYQVESHVWPAQYEAGGQQAFTLSVRQAEEMAELRLLARPAKPQPD